MKFKALGRDLTAYSIVIHKNEWRAEIEYRF